MKTFGITTWILGLLIASNGFAGGMDGGGGALIRDVDNAWFVANTTTVKYCINMDTANFGVTREQANSAFQDAVGYWKREFSTLGSANSELNIGTQTFVASECADADLTLQLGQLSAEQRLYLIQSEEFVSAVIRTSYDIITLRGKGFLYVAPQSGPNQIKDDGIVPNLWSRLDTLPLRLVFAHELGHVFGMKHSSAGGIPVLMRNDFPDYVARTKDSALTYSTRHTLAPGFFNFVSDEEGYCGTSQLQADAIRFFGIKGAFSCIKVAVDRKGFNVYVSRTSEINWELVGSATLDQKSRFWDGITAVTFFVPKEQTVFKLGTGYAHRGPYFITESFRAAYTSLDGTTKRDALVELRPNSLGFRWDFNIGGAIDNAILTDVIHR